MGRPTTEKKEKTVKLRISEELYEEVVKRGENVSETVRRMIKSSVNSVPQKKETEKLNVPQKEPSAFTELADSVKCYNLTGEEFLKKIITAMDKGKIVYEGGEFTVYDELDLSRFKAACDEKGVEYQKMIDKCTQMVWQI